MEQTTKQNASYWLRNGSRALHIQVHVLTPYGETVNSVFVSSGLRNSRVEKTLSHYGQGTFKSFTRLMIEVIVPDTGIKKHQSMRSMSRD